MLLNLLWLEKFDFHNRSVSDLRIKNAVYLCLKGRTKAERIKFCLSGSSSKDAGYTVGCATLTYGYENQVLSGHKQITTLFLTTAKYKL